MTGTLRTLNPGTSYSSVVTNQTAGYRAGVAITTALNTTAYGYQAASSVVASNSTAAFGYQAFKNGTGANNTAMGTASLSGTGSFASCAAFGTGALQVCTSSSMAAFGAFALQAATTATQSAAFGAEALKTVVTGANNTAMGYGAGKVFTGSDSTMVGNAAMFQSVSGTYYVCIGTHAGRYVTGGVGTTLVGADAGADASNPITSASRCVAVGQNALAGMVAQVDDAIGLGYSTIVQGARAIALGNTATATAINAVAIGYGVSATGAGSVAIGKDNAGTSASTSVANEIKLGTALHSVNVPGALAVTGVSTFTGQTKAANGSATAPSYSFANETNTGAYLSPTGEYRVATEGVLRHSTSSGGLLLLSGNLLPTTGTAQDLGSSGSPWRTQFIRSILVAGTTSAGGGVGVVSIGNATTVPTTNPTSGGVLYAEAGALKWRSSGGTVTTIAPV